MAAAAATAASESFEAYGVPFHLGKKFSFVKRLGKGAFGCVVYVKRGGCGVTPS
jgi:hypothetical protein